MPPWAGGTTTASATTRNRRSTRGWRGSGGVLPMVTPMRSKRRSGSSKRDPYFFRSGYARERVARRLAHADLTPTQMSRARVVVLSTVDGRRHCPLPGVGKLAGAVADNSLRRELRKRLHHGQQHRLARRGLQLVLTSRRWSPTTSAGALAGPRAAPERADWRSASQRRTPAPTCVGRRTGRPS